MISNSFFCMEIVNLKLIWTLFFILSSICRNLKNSLILCSLDGNCCDIIQKSIFFPIDDQKYESFNGETSIGAVKFVP